MKLLKTHIANGRMHEPGVEVDFTSGGIKIGEQTLDQIPVSVLQDEGGELMHHELMQEYWEGDKLRPEIRDRLLEIANGFYGESGFKAPILDIVLTGSIANFNYHAQSDLDVHVLIDYKAENADDELVKNAANGYRWKWNMLHDIMLQGHEVELYIQDVNEEHTSSGVYSILNDKWNVKPDYKFVQVDRRAIAAKANALRWQYADLQKRFDDGEVSEDLMNEVATLRYKMLHLRRDAFDSGEDEFSVGNLAFKELRNDETIGKAMKLENALYDKLMEKL